MSSFSTRSLSLGIILKNISALLVLGFLVYGAYFLANKEITLFFGIGIFILLSIFISVVHSFPFGATFTPILFEWWWLDITFWNFSEMAWIITGISMGANILFFVGVYTSDD